MLPNDAMADPITAAPTIFALTNLTSEATISLRNTIQSFRPHSKHIREVNEELEGLITVLGALNETLKSPADTYLLSLDLLLKHCGNACEGFQRELLGYTRRSDRSWTNFRDWASIRYMGDDIDGFRRLLAAYRATITIALADANIRKHPISTEVLDSYKTLLDSTADDLQERLESINGKLEVIERTAAEATSNSIELQAMKDRQSGILRCIQICHQSFEHSHQVDSRSWGRVNSSEAVNLVGFPGMAVNQMFQDYRDSLNLSIAKLERHLKSTTDRIAETSGTTVTTKDDSLDPTRLQEELETIRHCIEICSKAEQLSDDAVGKSGPATSPQSLVQNVQVYRHEQTATLGTHEIMVKDISRRLTSLQNAISSAVFETHRMTNVTDNTLATQQVIISNNDHLNSETIVAGDKSQALVGLMSDETLRQLLSSRLEIERKHTPGEYGVMGTPFQDWKRELLDIHQKLEIVGTSTYQNKAPTDSGYASMEASSLLIDTSEESASHNDSSLSPDRARADARRDNFRPSLKERIGRVVPSDEDIGSQKACSKIAEIVVAERHLENRLLESDILIAAARQIFRDCNMLEFLEDLRELLKYCHIDLRREARTNLQNATATLLRNHWFRARIARQIFRKIKNQETSDSDEEDENPRRASEKSLYDLNNWLANNQGFNDPDNGCRTPPEIDESQFSTDEETSDNDGELQEAVKDMKYIENMESFVFQSKSFRKLLERVQMLAISPVYHDIRRILMTLPDGSIEFDDEPPWSWLDGCKCWVEGRSNSRWDWWPTCQAQGALVYGSCRIKWKCHCGRRHHRDVPRDEGLKLKRLIELRDEPLYHEHLCFGRRKGRHSWRKFLPSSESWWASDKIKVKAQSSLATAQVRSAMPAPSSTSVSRTNEGKKTPGHNGRSPTSPQNPGNEAPDPSSCSEQTIHTILIESTTDLRLLLGVKAKRRCLDINQIDLNRKISLTDGDLMNEIVAAYKSVRGWPRLYFSIYQMRFCVFKKFLKYRRNRISSIQEGIPEHDDDYVYKDGSREPPGERPPISQEEFEDSLFVCTTPCIYWFWPWHECIGPLAQKRLYERIPKKKSIWALDCHDESEAWGLETAYSISIPHVFAYHVLLLAATFGFWAWWQSQHPDDLQGAGIPITVLLGLLSLFWTSLGVLRTSDVSR